MQKPTWKHLFLLYLTQLFGLDSRGHTVFVITVGSAGQALYAKGVSLGAIGSFIAISGTAVRIA